MKNLAAIALIMILLAGLAACQPQIISTLQPTIPVVTNTPLKSQPTARPTVTRVPVLNSPNSPPLLSLDMFTASDGWGLVANQLLLTHDGGVNWFSVPLPEGQVDENTRTFFLDVNKLYVLITDTAGQTGKLYYSQNGGGTWRINPVPFLHGQLLFIEGVGYFLESIPTGSNKMSSTIYNSADSGQTWNRILPGSDSAPGNSIPEDGNKTGFSFINSQTGWLGVAGQSQKVVLYKSIDGAHTWALQDIPVPQNIQSLVTNTLPPIFFKGNTTAGVLPVDFISQATGDRNRVFYLTKDSGAPWSPGDIVIDGGADSFIDPHTGWVWGKHGLYTTTNGAQSWQLLPVAFGKSETAKNIKFINANNGWLLTTDSKNRLRIYNTNDGGHTWIAINP